MIKRQFLFYIFNYLLDKRGTKGYASKDPKMAPKGIPPVINDFKIKLLTSYEQIYARV